MPPLGSHQPPATAAAIALQNWEDITPDASGAWGSVLAVHPLGTLLAGGGNGALKYSRNHGDTWSVATSPYGLSSSFGGFAYGAGKWVICGSKPTGFGGYIPFIASSSDAPNPNIPTAFTEHPVSWDGFETAVIDVAYDEFRGFFIAVSFFGQVATSGNGSNWTLRSSPLSTVGSARIAVGPSKILCNRQTPRLLTSANGLDWGESAEFGHSSRPIAYGNGIFVSAAVIAFTSTYKIIVSRDDGETWISTGFVTDRAPADIAYSGQEWLMSLTDAGSGGALATSRNAFDWRYIAPGINGSYAPASLRAAAETTRLRFPSPQLDATRQHKRWYGIGSGGVMRSLNGV